METGQASRGKKCQVELGLLKSTPCVAHNMPLDKARPWRKRDVRDFSTTRQLGLQAGLSCWHAWACPIGQALPRMLWWPAVLAPGGSLQRPLVASRLEQLLAIPSLETDGVKSYEALARH